MSDDDDTASTRRSRRSRVDAKKSSRLDALERLKSVRTGGAKNKYEIRELENVYDVVDETTYSRKVHARQRDDWIVDDGKGEYVEDGREIFDDDLIGHDEDESLKKPTTKKDKQAKKVEKEAQRANFLSVRDMLSAMPGKRKRSELNTVVNDKPLLTGEDLIGDLMKEIHEGKKPKKEPDFLDGLLLDENPRPRVSSKSSRAKLTSNVPKKKFVPFGGVKIEPPTSAVEFVDFEDASDNMEIFPSSPDPIPIPQKAETSVKSNGTSVLPARSSSSKASVTSNSNGNGIGIGIANTANNMIQPKPREPSAESKVKPIENFDSFGKIPEMNGTIESNYAGNAPSFVEADSKDNKILNFFWLDMFEEPRNPGVLYLFGKVQAAPNSYVSACVVVKGLTRCIYLLTRGTKKSSDELVNGVQVYDEFDQVVAPKFKINEFKSRPVQKKYCFEIPDIPSIGNYIEVRYSGTLPPLPADLEGETFSHVFGTATPLMENFLLEKKLKGPSWLQIKNPQQVEPSQQHCWSKMEFVCSVGDVKLNEQSGDMKIPPLTLASINVQATSDANSKKDTIVFVGVAVHKTFELDAPLKPDQLFHDYFCLVNKPPGEVWPLDVDQVFSKDNPKNKAMKVESERAMLGCLLAKLQLIDADIYLGHDLNFDLLLLHLLNLKVPHWSRIGRLKRSTAIGKNSKTLDYKSALAGRLFCDVKISAMELIRARSYDFQNLALQVLGKQTEVLTGPQMKELFDSANGLNYLINWGMEHCVLNIRLVNELQVMPLALQITAIAGNTLFRTLLGGRSERNEYLLLHAFHSKGFIVPDKYRPFAKSQSKEEDGETQKKNAGPSYAGGMVLDPKKGFYDNFIVLMDFNSLYPSIIQEFNICFTTRSQLSDAREEADVEKGVLPEEIRKLVESRRQVKRLMKGASVSPDQMRVYDIRQKAFKLTANSMYGCLGFRNSRFYAKELAALITEYGRDILLKTKDAVERMGHDVIYGDTDSLMINSNTKEIQKVFTIGNTIKSEINKMYRLLELEIDGVFRFLLLLKKKKYAALVWNQKPNGEFETSLELKGLDMVRRDWAPIASNTARLVLEEIMSEQTLDEKVFKIVRILGDIATKLKAGDVMFKDLLITKQLAKNPEEYKDAQGLYHVQVALRMNKSGSLGKKFRNGDTVPYLFCTDSLPHHLSELSGVSSNVEDNEKDDQPLQPDPNYYLAHQIHPVVSRICEPLEGLDGARIAEALGMDPASFRRRRTIDEAEDRTLGQESEAEKYIDCEKFVFKCPYEHCRKEIRLESLFVWKDSKISLSLMKCGECEGSLLPYINYISNKLSLFLRKFVTKYYQNKFICEDPTCDNVERGVPFALVNGYPPCSRCHGGLMCKDYRDSHLYKQLNYMHSILDIDKQLEGINDKEKEEIRTSMRDVAEASGAARAAEILRAILSRYLNSSGYSEIKLGYLFHGLFPKTGN